MDHRITITTAHTFWRRFWGIKSLKKGAGGLFLPSCRAIHTFGLRHDIDLVWLNQSQQIIKIENHIRPNQWRWCAQASSVLEMWSHSRSTALKVGDTLRLKGQALLETALVMPMLLLLIMGFLELCLMLQAQQKLTHGVQWAAQIGALTNNDSKVTGVLLERFDSEKIKLEIASYDRLSESSIASVDRRHHDRLRVAVQAPYHFNIPLLNRAQINLSAEASARVLCQESSPPFQCD